MGIDAKSVKELREQTGLPMMECKQALEKADGDISLAIDELRKSGAKAEAKLAGRKAEQGLIGMPPTRQLDQRFDGLCWQLPVADLQSGHNAIAFTLQKRGRGSDKSLQVARIEIVAMPSPDS